MQNRQIGVSNCALGRGTGNWRLGNIKVTELENLALPQFPNTLIVLQWQSKSHLALSEIATELKFIDFIFILRLYFQV